MRNEPHTTNAVEEKEDNEAKEDIVPFSGVVCNCIAFLATTFVVSFVALPLLFPGRCLQCDAVLNEAAVLTHWIHCCNVIRRS